MLLLFVELMIMVDAQMTTRLYRLWQPGNPKNRVFLPNFWMKAVETPHEGRHGVPTNVVKFEVHPQMTRHDIREYLTKIYELPVRDVRTSVQMGNILWNGQDYRYRKAMWKEDDKKFAFVTMARGFQFDFPTIFPEKEEDQVDKIKEQMKAVEKNSKFVNQDRNNVGNWFGV